MLQILCHEHCAVRSRIDAQMAHHEVILLVLFAICCGAYALRPISSGLIGKPRQSINCQTFTARKTVRNQLLSTTRLSFAPSPTNDKTGFEHRFLQHAAVATPTSAAMASSRPSSSLRATAKAAIQGWDLYGRVPYDDWLFTNEKLLDPNFYRKTLFEEVFHELPTAFEWNVRMRRINALSTGARMMIAVALIALFIKCLSMVGSGILRGFRSKEREVLGDVPVSARFKGRASRERTIPGHDDLVNFDPLPVNWYGGDVVDGRTPEDSSAATSR